MLAAGGVRVLKSDTFGASGACQIGTGQVGTHQVDSDEVGTDRVATEQDGSNQENTNRTQDTLRMGTPCRAAYTELVIPTSAGTLGYYTPMLPEAATIPFSCPTTAQPILTA